MALRAISAPAARAEAIDELHTEFFASTSRDSRAQREATWSELARAGGFDDPWDLSPALVSTVGAGLRRRGYRSASAYFTVAVQKFIEKQGVLTDELPLHLRRVRRACNRGRGPDKHAGALPLGRLAETGAGDEPWSPGGPCAPQRALLVGAWWLLREIEMAGAKLGHVSYLASGAIALLLPISKADPEARGATRAHICTCKLDIPAACCPRCGLSAQVEFARAEGERVGLPPPASEWPLFPGRGGSVPTKAGVVATIREAAQRLGLQLQEHNGAERFSGHS